MAQDGAQIFWIARGQHLAQHSCPSSPCGKVTLARDMQHLLFQVQRDLIQRGHMRRKIILDKDTQGTHCCKFHPLEQILEQWGGAVCQAGSSEHYCWGRVRTQLCTLVLPAKQWQSQQSSRRWRMIPDCLGNRDRKTRGRYFRPLAFEELSLVLCEVILGEMLTLHCMVGICLSLRKMGRGGWAEDLGPKIGPGKQLLSFSCLSFSFPSLPPTSF